jgi:hypothetical protein
VLQHQHKILNEEALSTCGSPCKRERRMLFPQTVLREVRLCVALADCPNVVRLLGACLQGRSQRCDTIAARPIPADAVPATHDEHCPPMEAHGEPSTAPATAVLEASGHMPLSPRPPASPRPMRAPPSQWPHMSSSHEAAPEQVKCTAADARHVAATLPPPCGCHAPIFHLAVSPGGGLQNPPPAHTWSSAECAPHRGSCCTISTLYFSRNVVGLDGLARAGRPQPPPPPTC